MQVQVKHEQQRDSLENYDLLMISTLSVQVSSAQPRSIKVDQGQFKVIRGKIISVILEESSGQNSRPNGQAGGDNVKTMKKNLLNDL